MAKIKDCERCRFYAHSHFLVCALHPDGVGTNSCPDFESAELWEPEDINAYQVLQEYDWHPLFTGRCPVCHRPFSRLKLPPLHWRCSSCGWEDDTF